MNRIFIIIIIIFIITIGCYYLIDNNSENKVIIDKGFELFGNEYCNGHETIMVDGWPSYSTCKICGIRKHNEEANSDFIICSECAKITGRCTKCGKLLK